MSNVIYLKDYIRFKKFAKDNTWAEWDKYWEQKLHELDYIEEPNQQCFEAHLNPNWDYIDDNWEDI